MIGMSFYYLLLKTLLMINSFQEHLILYPELLFILPVFIGSLSLILLSKEKETTKENSSPEHTKDNDKQSEYEKKYRDYINYINKETNQSDKKYQKLYTRIMGKVYLRKNIPSSQSLLRKLITRTYNHLSKRRIKYKRGAQDFRPIYHGIIYKYYDFYGYYYYAPITPVNKKRLYREVKKGEVNPASFELKKKRIPARYFLLSSKGLEDSLRLKGKYAQIEIFRRIFLPVIHILFHYDTHPLLKTKSHFHYWADYIRMFYDHEARIRVFGRIPKEGLLWTDSWAAYLEKWMSPRHHHRGRRETHKKPTIYRLWYTLSTNRISVYKQRKIKQRVRFLGKHKKGTALKRKRKKIRARTKYDRVTPYIYLNYYIFRRKSIQMLLKALHLNYSKYPIYKSSVRHMSHDLFSLLKEVRRSHKYKFLRNRRFRFLGPREYFKDIERTTKKKKKSKRKQKHWIRFIHHYKLRNLRKKLFRKPRKLKPYINFILSQWFYNHNQLNNLEMRYLKRNPLSKARLDFSMAAYAIRFPERFREMFQFELSRLKVQKKSYLDYLLKDPYGIQKIGSAFYYFLAPKSPLSQREELFLTKPAFNKENYNTLFKNLLALTNWATTEDQGRYYKRIARKRSIGRKRKGRDRPFFAVDQERRYNFVNLLNSLFRASILSYIHKNSQVKSNKKTSLSLPYDFLRKPINKPLNHLKTLYGYIFKTEQYRAFLYRRNKMMKKKKAARLYQSPKVTRLHTSKLRDRAYADKMFKRIFVRYPGKYRPFKRYLKLKIKNALPSEVNSLKDWYQLVKSWKNHPRQVTSTRYLHLPFHLKGYLLRKRFRISSAKKGLQPYRFTKLLKMGRYVKRYTRHRFRILNPKRHTLTRVSKASIRPNQMRHSLLNNQYLFMKELVEKYITQPTKTYYKYLALSIQSFQFFKLPDMFLLSSGFKNIKILKNKPFDSNHNNDKSAIDFFISYLFRNLLELLPIEKLIQYTSNKIVTTIYFFIFQLTLLVVTSVSFFIGFNVIQLAIVSILQYFSFFISPCIYIIHKINTCLGMSFNTFLYPFVYAISSTMTHTFRLFKHFSFYIGGLVYRLILPIWLYTRIFIQFFFFCFKTLFSIFTEICFHLFPVSFINLFIKVFYRLYAYFYNILFIRYIINSYQYVRNPRADWIEYRTIGFYYMIISKFRAKGWRFLYRWRIFRHMDQDSSEILQVQLIFTRYFSRIYHWFYRATRIYRGLLDMSYEYIWRAFFGDWVLTGYINPFRRLYFENYDLVLVAYMLYIFFSPLIFLNWIFVTFNSRNFSFYKDVIINIFFRATGYIFMYPLYFIYDQIYKIDKVNRLLISSLMLLYYYLVHLFKYIYHLTLLFHLILPTYFEVAHYALTSFYPIARRLLGGLNYTINFEEEVFTSYLVLLVMALTFLYLTFVHVRIPDLLITGYRILKLRIVNVSTPLAVIDVNYDLKLNRVLFRDFIESIYARFLYTRIFKMHSHLYSNYKILWFYKRRPAQSLLDYRMMALFYELGKALRLVYIRKHSDTLFRTSKGLDIAKLQTGWKLAIPFPYVKNQEWWELNKRAKPIAFWRFSWMSSVRNYAFMPRLRKYKEKLYLLDPFRIKRTDPVRVAYLGLPKKNKFREYLGPLPLLKERNFVPKKKYSKLRSIYRDPSYRSIKTGLSRTFHEYLGLRRYRPNKLRTYQKTYHIRLIQHFVSKLVDKVEYTMSFLFKLYRFNIYLLSNGILIILHLIIPNFIKKILNSFPSVLIFKAWWKYWANRNRPNMDLEIKALKKSVKKLLIVTFLNIMVLPKLILDCVNIIIKDTYVIMADLFYRWYCLFLKAPNENYREFLSRILSFEQIDNLALQWLQVFKKTIKLIKFRLFRTENDPFEEYRNESNNSNSNLLRTNFHAISLYKDNSKKHVQFKQGRRYFDYVTSDEMKNQ